MCFQRGFQRTFPLILSLILTSAATGQTPRVPAKPTIWEEKQTGIQFIQLKPGTFLMGEGKDAKKAEIKAGFSLSSTVVTQTVENDHEN